MKTGKILSIAFGVIVIGTWIVPGWENTKILKNDVTTLEAQKKEKVREIKALELEVKEGAHKSDSVLKVIPFSREQERLIQVLLGVASGSGFVFHDLSFGKGENATINAAQTTISFSAEGLKKNIPIFLDRIEKSTRFIGMDSLNVTIKETETEPHATLNVVLYALSQDLSE